MLKGYNTKHESIEPMNPEWKKQLREEFAQEVEKLSELTGRDLTAGAGGTKSKEIHYSMLEV